jgi:peptidoglycan hydrolase-like protein with peptidoglycan-binding domain
MPLGCKLFKGDRALEGCLVQDSAHVTQGAAGEHVAKIQNLSVSPDELQTSNYGPSTAKAVLDFKTKRNIINRSYETRVDNIVGKMTIAALDKEMRRVEAEPRRQLNPHTFSRQVS